MAFFVVERSALDSSLSIPLSEGYPTREAAIAALSAAATAGHVTLTGEVFIADLGNAVPVLIMQAPVPAPTTESETSAPSETAAVSEVRESAGALDAAGGDAAYASWEPLDEVPADLPTLADAIKRATASLEDEGIVAPDSVESDSGTDVERTEDVSADLSAPAAVEEPASVTPGVAGDAKEAEWPWANIEAYEASDTVPEDDAATDSDLKVATAGVLDEPEQDEIEEVMPSSADLPEVGSLDGADEAELETPVISETLGASLEDEAADVASDLAAELSALGVGLGESSQEDAPIITSAPPEGEDAYVPRPVIMGDYADAAGDGDAVEPESSDAAIPEESSDEEAGTIEFESVILETETVFSMPILSEEEGGYAVTGELVLTEYTCVDCVYSNTCPKVGQATPADCGSFQWKSE